MAISQTQLVQLKMFTLNSMIYEPQYAFGSIENIVRKNYAGY